MAKLPLLYPPCHTHTHTLSCWGSNRRSGSCLADASGEMQGSQRPLLRHAGGRTDSQAQSRRWQIVVDFLRPSNLQKLPPLPQSSTHTPSAPEPPASIPFPISDTYTEIGGTAHQQLLASRAGKQKYKTTKKQKQQKYYASSYCNLAESEEGEKP